MLMTSCIIKGKLRNGAVIDTAPYLPSKRKKHTLPAPAMASLKRLTFKQKSQRHASGIVEAKVRYLRRTSRVCLDLGLGERVGRFMRCPLSRGVGEGRALCH